jgi:hypothetical protein
MIAATLIFFEKEEWQRFFGKFFKQVEAPESVVSAGLPKAFLWLAAVFIFIQLLLPFRHFLYKGNVIWNEMGFRYSWNVMRVEKNGYVEFTCIDPKTAKSWQVYPKDFLSDIQEKQMSFQPDMILEFAHFLERHYQKDLQVFAYSRVSVNGESAKALIDPSVDLTKKNDSFLGDYNWLLD